MTFKLTEDGNIHNWLSSKIANLISWISAGLGLGTFMGVVNLTVGILSACWLVIQMWNMFTYTRKKNKLELEILQQRLENGRK